MSISVKYKYALSKNSSMAGVSPDILTMQHQEKFQRTNIIFKIETLAMGEKNKI